MPKFIVSPDMAPGVARANVGFFRPDSVITLPDAASRKGEKPNLKLIPVDQEAYDALVAAWGKERVAAMHGPAFAPPKPPDKGDPDDAKMTPAQAAKRLGSSGK